MFLSYLGAVFGHWRASVSGFGALVVGGFLQWNSHPSWWPRWADWAPMKSDEPKFWLTVSACCFALAMYQAWKDEHQARIGLERRGPKLALEYRPDLALGAAEHPRWYLANDGDSDAVNIQSGELRAGNAGAVLVRVHRLPKGEAVEVEFAQEWKGNYVGRLPHPAGIFEAMKQELGKAFDESGDSGDSFVATLTELVAPIRLTYSDVTGAGFESTGEIHWNRVIGRGYYAPLAWGRSKPRSRWKRLKAQLFKRRSSRP